MISKTHIQLNSNIISRVPLHIYDKDFTFIVNGKFFETSKIISDLLSPIICKQHLNDVTMDTFTINTVNQGNFQHVLNLANFEQNSIPDSEIPFLTEVIEFLGITSLDISDHAQYSDLSEYDILCSIKLHERFPIFYSKRFESDIEFISKSFYSICETHFTELLELLPTTIEKIISNSNLTLNNEDQLVTFLNKYIQNSEHIEKSNSNSNFYEYVMFSNISVDAMTSFLDSFDLYDFDRQLWKSVSKRLKHQIIKTFEENSNTRYKNQMNNDMSKFFKPETVETFCGIIKYIRNKSNNDIKSKINITASSIYGSDFLPENAVLYEDKSKRFESENKPDNWICFEFKENKISPSHYQIMPCCRQNYSNPKSWVIEASNDGCNWEILDEKVNCSELNEAYKPKIFQIENQGSKDYTFIRMRLTGPTWYDSNYFILCSFELYGKLI